MPISQPTLEQLKRFFPFKVKAEAGGDILLDDGRGEEFAFHSNCGTSFADPIYLEQMANAEAFNPSRDQQRPPQCGITNNDA